MNEEDSNVYEWVTVLAVVAMLMLIILTT